MARFARFKSVVTRLGWFTAVIYFLAVAFRRFFPFFSIEQYFVVAQPVSGDALLPERLGSNVSILQVDGWHPLIASLNRPRDELVRRFSQGAVCFLAVREGRVIGHLWITQSPYREPVHRCEFVPQPRGRAAWDFDMWVDSQERLSFAFAKLWDRCNAYLFEHGIEWTFSRVSAFNTTSLKAHERLGMRKMHSLVCFGAGRLELLVANVAPILALSISQRTCPVIRVKSPTA